MTMAFRFSALVIAVTSLAACSSLPVGEPADGPPAHTPSHLATLPELIPVDEPLARYGNPETYEVFGRTYRTWDSADGYVEEGIASWYGRKFHGRRTSSGEPYDMYALSAAHRYLPLPTFVRVTNLDNDRTTVLRVNDRGPFHSDRFIDLSYAAAVKLGFHERGTARVRVETVRPTSIEPRRVSVPTTALASAPNPASSVPRAIDAKPVSPSQYVLQAGAFSGLEAADRLARELSVEVSAPAYVVRTNDDGYYRVRLGPFPEADEARRLQALIAARLGGRVLLLEQ